MGRRNPLADVIVEGASLVGGVPVRRSPWCDCEKKGHGYTKRSDGAWVRPCCMRREKAAFLKFGDHPVPTPGSESEPKQGRRKR